MQTLKDSTCYDPQTVGAGLLNINNTCFLNSVLQCLVHTVPLVQKLRASDHYASCPGKDRNEFCSLCALKQHVDECLYMSGFVIAPRRFYSNLTEISSDFSPGNQEDAHEFLNCFLNHLHSCCLTSSRSEKPLSFEVDSLVNQVFGGLLKSQVRCCDCGHTRDISEPLLDLSLEVNYVESVVDALESFTRSEEISFTCEACKAFTKGKKQYKFDRAPQVLVLHLKRFKSRGSSVIKINDYLDYPMVLDLNPFVSCPSDEEEVKYELYAMIIHISKIASWGHYYSIVRSSENEWHGINDATVWRFNENFIEYEDPYMLFYIKQGSSPWFSRLMEMEKTLVEATPLQSKLDQMNRKRTGGETEGHCTDSDTDNDTEGDDTREKVAKH